jgi:hypothetical protein
MPTGHAQIMPTSDVTGDHPNRQANSQGQKNYRQVLLLIREKTKEKTDGKD